MMKEMMMTRRRSRTRRRKSSYYMSGDMVSPKTSPSQLKLVLQGVSKITKYYCTGLILDWFLKRGSLINKQKQMWNAWAKDQVRLTVRAQGAP